MSTVELQFKARRDPAATWTSNDPTLNEGEFGYETDTGLFKIGNGVSSWTTLSYATASLLDCPTFHECFVIEQDDDTNLDQNFWKMIATGDGLSFQLRDDADANTSTFMQVERSGTGASMATDSVAFTTTTLSTTGDVSLANDAFIQWGSSAVSITGSSSTDKMIFATGSTDALTIEADASLTANVGLDVTGALTATSYGGILEANLLDKTAIESVSAIWNFTGTYLGISNANPYLVFQETDAALDQKIWRWQASGESFLGRIIDDSNSYLYNWIQVQRSGTGASVQVDTIDLTAVSDITLNSNTIVTGTFTSLGIDDNATGERLQLADGSVAFGDGSAAEAWLIAMRTTTDGSMELSGSNNANTGANLRLYGDTHLTLANDWALRAGSTNSLYWDNSATTLTATASNFTVTGNINMDDSQELYLDANSNTYISATSPGYVRIATNGSPGLDVTGSQNVIAYGDLTVNGAFTSQGIDDNATTEVLQLSSTNTAWGDGSAAESWSHIVRTVTTGSMGFWGGNSNLDGGGFTAYGSTHATLGGDVIFRSSNNTWMQWDESGGDLYINTGTGSKTLAVTFDQSQNATFTGSIISDGALQINGDINGQTLTSLDNIGTQGLGDNTIANGLWQFAAITPLGTLPPPPGGTDIYGFLLQIDDGAQPTQLYWGGTNNEEGISVRRKDSGVWNEWVDMITNDRDHTLKGNIAITGTFTSLGLDDNASAEVLQLSDSAITLGSAAATAWNVNMANDTYVLRLNAGNITTSGASLRMYGGSHASAAGDTVFTANNTTWLLWDESAGDLTIYSGTGAKTVGITLFDPTTDQITLHRNNLVVGDDSGDVNTYLDASVAGTAYHRFRQNNSETGRIGQLASGDMTFVRSGKEFLRFIDADDETFVPTGRRLVAGDALSTSGASVIEGTYSGLDRQLVLGSLRSSGNTVLCKNVRPDPATANSFESANAAGSSQGAFEVGGNDFSWWGASSATPAIGTDVSMTELMNLNSAAVLTLNPDRTLTAPRIDIDGAATSSPQYRLLQNGTTKAYMQYANSSGVFNIDGDGNIALRPSNTAALTLSSNGGSLVGGIQFAERADHAYTPTGAYGEIWVKSDTPNKLYFTDDAGTDHDLTAGGGLTKITSTATTSGTTHDITIPSGAVMVSLTFNSVSTNATDLTRIQLGDAGGIETTGYATTRYTQTGSAIASPGTSTAGWDFGNVGSSQTATGVFTMYLTDESNGWVGTGTFIENGSNITWHVTGEKPLSGELTTIRVTTDTASTFDAGSICVVHG